MACRVGVCVVLLVLVAAPVRAESTVGVIEPPTGKGVALAVIRISTPQGQTIPWPQVRTGRSGEPTELEPDPRRLDGRWGQLLLSVEEEGIPGQMRITYDQDRFFWRHRFDLQERVWKPAHRMGNWRPEHVFRLDEDKSVWVAFPYAAYKAAMEVAEKRRVDPLVEDFVRQIGGVLKTAALNGLITGAESGVLSGAWDKVARSPLKNPIDPALNAQLSSAIRSVLQGHLPALDPGVADVLEKPLAPDLAELLGRAMKAVPTADERHEIEQIGRELVEIGLAARAASIAASAGLDVKTLQRNEEDAALGVEIALRRYLEYLRPIVKAGSPAPIDDALRSSLQRALKANVNPALREEIQSHLDSPQDPNAFRAANFLLGGLLAGMVQDIDQAVDGVVLAGLNLAAFDPKLRLRLDPALDALDKVLDRIYGAGGDDPLTAQCRRHVSRALEGIEDAEKPAAGPAPVRPLVPGLPRGAATDPAVRVTFVAAPALVAPAPLGGPAVGPPGPLGGLGAAPPGQSAVRAVRLRRLFPHPLVMLQVDVATRASKLLESVRTGAPEPPTIRIPTAAPWVVPAVTYRHVIGCDGIHCTCVLIGP